MMRKFLLACSAIFLLASCSDDAKTTADRPNSQIEARQVRSGSITGDEGGLAILGRKDNNNEGGGALGVNSFLWRATLDTLAFMPLVSADPFGGVIITDWYEDPKTPGQRYKINALILDKTLRADGVKITLFKQRLDHGTWHDQKVDSKLQTDLEDTILTRARQLKVTQIKN